MSVFDPITRSQQLTSAVYRGNTCRSHAKGCAAAESTTHMPNYSGSEYDHPDRLLMATSRYESATPKHYNVNRLQLLSQAQSTKTPAIPRVLSSGTVRILASERKEGN